MTNTIGIEVDTSQATRAVGDFRSDVAKLRGEFEASDRRAKEFNETVSSIKRAGIDQVSDSLKGLVAVAKDATAEVKKLANEIKQAGKPITIKLLIEGRERLAGLVADIRAVAVAAIAADSAMAKFLATSQRASNEGGKSLSAQARPSLLSGSSPQQQQRIAGPIIDLQPISQASNWFQKLREYATSAWTAVKRFSADESGSVGIAQIGAVARTAGQVGLVALRVAAIGAGAAIGGIALVAATPFAALAIGTRAAYNALGGLTGMLSSIGSGLSSLAGSIAGVIGKIGGGLLAALGAGGLGFSFLAKQALETADSVTLFERRLSVLSDGMTGKANDMRSAIFGIADATRSSVDKAGSDFTRFNQVLSKTGASVDDIQALMTGAGAAMKLGGTSTQEAERAMTQFFQILAKGKADLQDLKSIQQSAPALSKLFEDSMGKSLSKIHEEAKKGPKEAQAAWSRIASYIAQQAPILAQKLAQMPRTMSEGMQQLKTTWFQAVADMQRNSDFMSPVLGAIDRIKAVIGGEAFKQGFGYILQTVTSTAEKLINWIASGETIGSHFLRISAHFQNISKYTSAALADIQALARSKLPSWLGGQDAGESEVGKLKAEIDKQLATQRNADLKSPWQVAITGDPLAAAKVRVDEGLDDIRGKLSKFDAKLALRFDDAGAAASKAALVAAAETAAKDASIAMTRAAESGFTMFDASVTRPLNQATEKLAIFREQLQTNTVNPAAFDGAKSAIDDLATAATNAEGKLGELKKVRDEALGNGNAVGVAIADAAIVEYGGKVDELTAKLKEALAFKSALENGDFSGLGVPKAAKAGTNQIKTSQPAATKSGGGGGRDIGKSMAEKLAALRAENELTIAQISGNQQLVREKELALDVERSITAEMRKQKPEMAAAIEAEINRKHALMESKKTYEAFKQAGEQVASTLIDNFMKVGEGTLKFKDALKQSLVQMIKLVAQAAILKPLTESIGRGFGSAGQSIFGGGGGLGSLFGGGSGGGGIGGFGSSTSFNLGSLFGFAKGGAFDGGVQMFANGGAFTNGIVSSPTAFNMGVMGEGGSPEAIMPLTRMPGGKLGVSAKGGGGTGVSNVNNITFNVAGSIDERSKADIIAEFDMRMAASRPGIIRDAKAAVRRENIDSAQYLKR